MDELKLKVLFLAGMFSLNTCAAADLIQYTRHKIQSILHRAEAYRDQDTNTQIKFFINQMAGYPYLFAKGANNPIYRFDGFDCQTFVQTTMALLHSRDLTEFDTGYMKIAYGAASRLYGLDPVIYNRNHFVEADLNPVNRRNGWFEDITSKGELAEYAKTITAVIDRQNWFAFQGRKFPFHKQTIQMSYLPKESLALQSPDGRYAPNDVLIAKIPTPSVVEIINDPHKWIFRGKRIKKAIGTELTVSHMGLLYRQSFRQGEIIYHRIICGLDWQFHKKCTVTAVTCQKEHCDELMLAHATDEYPSKFYWYKQYGNYVCSPNRPAAGVSYTRCNRVEKLPLFSYLTNYHYGSYWIMMNPALLGVHIEKLR